MNFNFPLILVVITGLTGLYWLIDALFFARRRTGDEPVGVELARQFFPVLAIVLILRSFIFEPFRIPSGSMIPTLLVGDFILVSKFSYGVRLPVIHTKILDTGEPQTGDVAVFRFPDGRPDDPDVDYIKRVIGVPGDKITLRGKDLLINGELVEYSEDKAYVMPGFVDKSTEHEMKSLALRSGTLNGREHDILVDTVFRGGMRRPDENLNVPDSEIKFSSRLAVTEYNVVVPEGHYFMLGDNRDRSNDSRAWGFVPEANLVGRAKYVWMHWNKGILWSRLGERIR